MQFAQLLIAMQDAQPVSAGGDGWGKVDRVGIAPLTSMYFLGENDRQLNDRNRYDEFRRNCMIPTGCCCASPTANGCGGR